MGDSSQTTTSQSQTRPWDAALPAVNGLLGQLQGLIPNTGTNAAQNGAIAQLTQMGQAGNPYASDIGSAATDLLHGGGAMNYAPTVQNAYDTYRAQTMPLASNTNYDPYSTPGFSDALKTSNGDITNNIQSLFAAGGRDLSGMNVQTLARGLSQGNSQAIANQYNQNVANQQGASGNLFNAGNTTGTTLANMNQAANANKAQGVQTANAATAAQTWGPQQVLQAQQLAQSIPMTNLGLLTQIGVPLAALGTNANSQSTTENHPSLLSDLSQIGGLFSSGGGGTSAMQGIANMGGGFLKGGGGLLAMLGL
jgi:hypothetical protein